MTRRTSSGSSGGGGDDKRPQTKACSALVSGCARSHVKDSMCGAQKFARDARTNTRIDRKGSHHIATGNWRAHTHTRALAELELNTKRVTASDEFVSAVHTLRSSMCLSSNCVCVCVELCQKSNCKSRDEDSAGKRASEQKNDEMNYLPRGACARARTGTASARDFTLSAWQCSGFWLHLGPARSEIFSLVGRARARALIARRSAGMLHARPTHAG